MFLKSLEIRGFKSFADKTELKFKKGVTAVVGPNGSGKSNISDSVRWVLGEQSIKTLRGGKMEDVIFAGTQYRKPLGLAQVSLTLDNEDGALDTEYNEVTVSRRIFRSGETEYLINNTKCRLKDITKLFMDTGIGKEGYSLIGQGKIEAVLSGKPEERRNLVEEAAGIVKYKSRKEEAEKKLDNTEDNLVRIRDIISTYEERLEPLRKEREKALKYRDLAEELKVKEVSILIYFIDNVEKQLSELNEQLFKNREELSAKTIKLNHDKEGLQSVEKEIDKLENKDKAEKKIYYKKKEEIVQIKNDIILDKERISSAKDNIIRSEKFLQSITEKINVAKNQKEILEAELKKSYLEQKNKDNQILELEKSTNDISSEINKIENKIKSLKDDEFELLRGQSEIKNSITLISSDISKKEDKQKEIEQSSSFAQGNIKINLATLDVLNTKIERITSDVKTIELGITEKRKEISKLKQLLNKKDTEYRDVTKKINEIEANKNMLINLEKHYEGYNRTVKNLMDRISDNTIKFAEGTKVLGEVFSVTKEYETAIEVALGAGISNVITTDEKIAKNLINYLKDNRLGRATFLPLNNIKGNKLDLNSNITGIQGYIGIASEIIKFPSMYEKAINNALGRTIVCSDMDSALNISRKGNNNYRIVTLTGEIIAPGGAMTGGSQKAKNTSILGRKREIEEMSLLLEEKITEQKRLENEIESIKIKQKNSDDEILNSMDEIHSNNIEITKLNGELSALKNETEKLNHTLEITKGEHNRNISEIEKLKGSLERKNQELQNIENQNTSNKTNSSEFEQRLNELKNTEITQKETLTSLKISKASFDEIIQGKKNDFHRKEQELRENTQQVNEYQKEKSENQNKIKELETQIKIKEDEILKTGNVIAEFEETFKKLEAERIKLKDEYKNKEAQINSDSLILNKEESEINRLEIQKAKRESEKDSYYTKLNDELELSLEEAKDIAKEISDVNEYKENVSDLKRRVTALGVVNLASIEEYIEVKEKYEFMYTQEQDLEKAKEELNTVIFEMTDKMKEVFRENFKILNENFNETFRELFKGGNAELILGEGDELSANIEINVEPPGKKLQNINLMSGGEKVLSAIALMFAILKMKPTPFCILDEIEAALDDANVFRYAEFLKAFSTETQFIVITHRKGTMEASDMLYGVTMEEKGISKVVSVDISSQVV